MTTPGAASSDISQPRALRARWVFPVEGPPLKNGIVTCFNGQIVSVGASTDVSKVEDLGETVLLPGLVNCHTHLEFSYLPKPLGQAGMNLPDWIWYVVWFRKTVEQEHASTIQGVIAHGLNECWNSGSAVIGEIATRPWSEYTSSQTSPFTVYFSELLGSSAITADSLCDAARNSIRYFSRLPGLAGLSPHAPYTTHPTVLECVVGLSASRFVPLAMHLAESHEELELLRSRRGRFVTLLRNLDAWNPESLVFKTPMGYLQQLARASRALIIHGNYLDNEEISFVAAQRERLSVIYCPRTHAYFGHGRYPLAKMLGAGVRVAVGTDSRASNPDLLLFEELRYIAAHFPEIGPETILNMGTLLGAEALGLSHEFGSLAKDKVACFAVAQITTTTNDPYEALWTSTQTHSFAVR